MTQEKTFLQRAAGWVSGLEYRDLPESVVEKVRYQFLSVLAGVFTGAETRGGRAAMDGILSASSKGPATLLATGDRIGVRDAVAANAVGSIALDFDDYLFMGHTGHSAVLTALSVGEETNASGEEILCAAAAANEIEARLGASAALGPLNGQMWSFIHGAGAAAAASRLYGLEARETAWALALSLSQPRFPLQAGFMGTEAKLLTAALPACDGVLAARLAQKGLEGPVDLLEHPRGFYHRFSFHPLRGMLEGLGSVWLTETLCYKMHPGCAYFMAALDALEEVQARVRADKGKGLAAMPIQRIACDVPLLGVAVDRLNADVLGASRRGGDDPEPVEINFSLKATLALAVLSDGLRPPDFAEDNLSRVGWALKDLSERVTVRHHWPYTIDLLKTVGDAFGGRLPLGDIGPGNVASLVGRAADEFGGSVLNLSEIPGLAAELLPRLPALAARRRRGGGSDLSDLDTEKMTLPLSARIRVELTDGTHYEAECRVPSGSPGSEGYPHIVEQKFRESVSEVLPDERVKRILEAVMALPDTGARELAAACAEVGGGK